MTAEVAPTRWRVLQVLPILDQLRGYRPPGCAATWSPVSSSRR